jgi:amino acid adenylation domain-containing protein
MNQEKQSINCTAHQQRLWFIDQFERRHLYAASPVYHNLPVLLKLNIPGTANTLTQAIQILAEKNEILRTRIEVHNGLPYLHVADGISFPLTIHHSNQTEEAALMAECLQWAAAPFNMEEDVLFRFSLVHNKKGENFLLLTAHHIMADRQTLKLLLQQLIVILKGEAPVANDATISFSEFAQWQNGLTPTDWEPFVFYWKRKLMGAPVLLLDTDQPRAAIHIYEHQGLQWQGTKALCNQISSFCTTNNIESLVFFTALLHTLLHRYSGQQEIVMGVLYPNRDEEGLPQMTGPAANLITLKNNIAPLHTFKDVLLHTTQEYEASVHHAAMPFEDVVLAVAPENDMSRTALFDVMMHYDREWTFQEDAQWMELNAGLGKYDINLLLTEGNGTFSLHLSYNKLYFLPERMERLLGHLETLAENVLDNPLQKISTVRFISTPEIQELTQKVSEKATFMEATITQLFERQVEKTPGNTAIVFETTKLTYRQLNDLANRLAHFLLQQYHVQKEELVVVQLERSEWLIITLLAVLKAGGCYVPADPAYPDDRLQYIKNDAAARLVIDEQFLHNFQQAQDRHSSEAVAVAIQPEQLAYIIYTSGSTGLPKGVLVEHRNVAQLLHPYKSEYDFNEADAWLLFHSVCFDFSVWEMYGALLFGGKLVVPSAETVKDPELCFNLIGKENITVLNQTPSAFYHLAAEAEIQHWPAHSIRYVIFGGEALLPARLFVWYENYPHTRLANMFGITETTVHVTYKEITAREMAAGASNIGKPISTLYGYVLDEQQQLLPAGITGELYVGGAGMARGYLNRPELTQQRFIEDPFHAGKKLYRSGDKVRLNANGDFDYLGRADDQIKIRGYRVEPGEIATVLEKNPLVKKALVFAAKNGQGEQELLAFVTGCDRGDEDSLRNYLTGVLPGYMVPAYIIAISQIPVTVNGKTDKQALLNIRQTIGTAANTYQTPETETEKKLAVLWMQVLEKDRAGKNDHFFHTGGHSLKAIQLQQGMGYCL